MFVRPYCSRDGRDRAHRDEDDDRSRAGSTSPSRSSPSAPTPADIRGYVEEFPHLHVLAGSLDGEDVGVGARRRRAADARRAECFGTITVAPGARGCGLGSALYRALSDWAREQDFVGFRGNVKEGDETSLAWVARRGFAENGRELRLELDLTTFDPPPIDPPEGIEIVTWAERPDAARGLYDVYREASPGHSRRRGRRTRAVRGLARARHARPRGQAGGDVRRLRGREVVGYSKFALTEAQPTTAYHDLTGVKRAWRGRGIAAALKRDADGVGEGARLRAPLDEQRGAQRADPPPERALRLPSRAGRGSSSADRSREGRRRPRVRRAARRRGGRGARTVPPRSPRSNRDERALPHGHPHRERRLGGRAVAAADSRPRGRRDRRGGRRRGGSRGRHAGRDPVARTGVRRVRALRRRAGEPLRAPAQHGLLARRLLRRADRRGRALRRARPGRGRPRRRRAAHVRRADDVRRAPRAGTARATASRCSASAASGTWPSSTRVPRAPRRSPSTSSPRSSSSRRSSAPRTRSRPARPCARSGSSAAPTAQSSSPRRPPRRRPRSPRSSAAARWRSSRCRGAASSSCRSCPRC